jgi:hypothetical protein
VTGGPGALLVSPFNMKWRFSGPTGGVEGLRLCLFSVIMPAKGVSGVSPRFHYRRLTFCFLPLATILESLMVDFSISLMNVIGILMGIAVKNVDYFWEYQHFYYVDSTNP